MTVISELALTDAPEEQEITVFDLPAEPIVDVTEELTAEASPPIELLIEETPAQAEESQMTPIVVEETPALVEES